MCCSAAGAGCAARSIRAEQRQGPLRKPSPRPTGRPAVQPAGRQSQSHTPHRVPVLRPAASPVRGRAAPMGERARGLSRGRTGALPANCHRSCSPIVSAFPHVTVWSRTLYRLQIWSLHVVSPKLLHVVTAGTQLGLSMSWSHTRRCRLPGCRQPRDRNARSVSERLSRNIASDCTSGTGLTMCDFLHASHRATSSHLRA
jgi:hypothetical protein